ncbi:MAG: HEAT repeat domain-containing protein [Planctomycetota bacterium]|jgi:HEAT repeat protein
MSCKSSFFLFVFGLSVLLIAVSSSLTAEEHISKKLQRLASGDYKKRNAAAGEVAGMGRDVLPYLLPALKPSKDKNLRIGTLLALKKLGADAASAAPEILQLFKERDPDIRFAAVDALVWIQAAPTITLHPLISLLKDEDMRVSYVAATALGRLGEKAVDAVPFLLQSLEAGNAQAAYAVGQIGYKEGNVYEALTGALKAENYLVRAQSIKAVGRLFKVKAIEHIKGRLADNSSYVSKTAEMTLLSIKPELKDDIKEIKEKLKSSSSVDSSDGERSLFIINPLPELKKK